MPKPKIITLFNHKGGVGKTTVAHNLGVSLTKQGKNVLLIDADPQMNLTSSFIGLADSVEYADSNESKWLKILSEYANLNQYLDDYSSKDTKTNPKINTKLYEYVLWGDREEGKQQSILNYSELSGRGVLKLLCGSVKFAFENKLNVIVANKNVYKDSTIYSVEEGIRELGKDFDYIIIDSSPSANSILNGVLVMMSDYLILPVFPNFFSLQALQNFYPVLENWIMQLETFKVTSVERGLSFRPKFLGLIINMAKRFEDEKGNKTTIYAEKWKKKLNDSLEKIYIDLYETKRVVPKDEFKKIFSPEEPFIIQEICDFTGQIRNISELAGCPVVDLNKKIANETVKDFNSRQSFNERKMQQINIEDENTHYGKAFKAVNKSYNFIAKSIAENL